MATSPPAFYPVLSDTPPSYNEAVGACPTGPPSSTVDRIVPLHGLTAVDFHARPGGKFSSLLDLANNWLKDNIMWQVKKCETVCFPSNAGIAEVQKMVFTGTTFVKTLRLWLTPRLYPHAKPQQIVSFAVVPNMMYDKVGNITFEDFQNVVNRLNERLLHSPINGHILSAAAEVVKVTKRSVSPEEILYVEGGISTRILRVFYEVGRASRETISVFDFHPQLVPGKAADGSQLYERFSNLLERVQNWCLAQIVNVCNIQVLPIDVVNGSEKVSLRGVRLFTLQSSLPVAELPSSNFIAGPLTCKTFLPIQLTERLKFRHWKEPPTFESMKQTLIHINTWARNNAVKFISAETCAVKVTDCAEGPESMVLSTSGKYLYTVWVIRVYVDGLYPLDCHDIEYAKCCTGHRDAPCSSSSDCIIS